MNEACPSGKRTRVAQGSEGLPARNRSANVFTTKFAGPFHRTENILMDPAASRKAAYSARLPYSAR